MASPGLAKNEIVTAFMADVRSLALINKVKVSRTLEYRDTFNWVLSTAQGNSPLSEACRNVLKPLRTLMFDTYKEITTQAAFEKAIFKNTYFSQCFKVAKHLVQARNGFQTPDKRALHLWRLHLEKMSPELVEDSESRPVCPPPYSFRTVSIEGMFPIPKRSEEKTVAKPFLVTLFYSVVHASCVHEKGPFSGHKVRDTRQGRRGKKRTREDTEVVEEVQPTPNSRSDNQNFYRIPTAKSGKNPLINLSRLITALLSAWDKLANSLMFNSCETMLAPYMQFNMDTLQYEPVPDDLLARTAQSHTLDNNSTTPVVPSMDVCASFAVVFFNNRDTSARIEGHHVNPDKFLRGLAKLFLDKFNAACFDEKYYKETPNAKASQLIDILLQPTQQDDGLPDFIVNNIDMANLRRFRSLHNSLLVDKAILDMSHLLIAPTTAHHRIPRRSPTLEDEDSEPEPDQAGDDDGPSSSSHIQVRSQTSSCKDDCDCHTARTDLLRFVKKYCRLYHCSFQELQATDRTNAGIYDTAIENNVQLVVTDPPYNVRREGNRTNSDYDLITTTAMKQCVNVVSNLLAPGGHLILFCSATQFGRWYRYIRDFTDDGQNPVFNVDATPLLMLPFPGHHSRKGSPMTFTLRNVAEYALHAFRRVHSPAETKTALNHVQYKVQGHIHSTFPGYSNVVNNIPRLAPGECVRVDMLSAPTTSAPRTSSTTPPRAPTGTCSLRPEQKNVKLLRELISRFTDRGDIVVDLFSGTFTAAAAALTLPHHRRFVGCDLDPLCVEMGNERMLDIFATMVQNETHRTSEVDLEVPEDIEAKARLFYAHVTCKHNAATSTLPHLAAWVPPPNMPSAQILPLAVAGAIALTVQKNCDISQLFARRQGNFLQKLHKIVETTAPSTWPAAMSSYLAEMDMDYLLSVDAMSNDLIIDYTDSQKCIIRSSTTFQPNATIGTINGGFVYRDLRNELLRNKTKVYGSGIFATTPIEFKHSALYLVSPQDNMISEHEVFLLPAPFCSLKLALLRGGNREETNAVIFNDLKSKKLNSFNDLLNNAVLRVVATKPIARFDPIYIDCTGVLFRD